MPIVSFTRPADTTAYASGDLVANSTTAGSVVAPVVRPVHSAGGWPGGWCGHERGRAVSSEGG